jgi:O-antigen ligase
LRLLYILRNPSFRFSLALISFLGIIIGMFASRAMMSIGMVLIGIQFFLKPDLKNTFLDFIKDRKLLFISLIFVLYLISGIYSSDMKYFTEKLMLKIPLLLMPLGFAALKDIPRQYLLHALAAFVILVFIASVASTVMYIMNFEEITENYKYAKVLPIIFGMNHIRFSLMLALAIFSSFFLYYKKYFVFDDKIEKFLFLGTGIFIFIFLHILSVRSGLLAFYISVFVIILSYIFQKKKYLNGIVLLSLMVITPILMYFAVPTIRNKIDYMIRDISIFMNMKGKGNKANDYSDSNRLLSIKLGIELGNTSPWIGLGLGDVRNEIFKAYTTKYPKVREDRRLIPHNQFVYVYMAVGGIGLLLFCFFCFYPLFLKSSYSGILFISTNTIFISSYLSESTLENQLGVYLFITFYLITYFIDRETNQQNL